jgi:hypothetical protein
MVVHSPWVIASRPFSVETIAPSSAIHGGKEKIHLFAENLVRFHDYAP